MIRTSHVGSFPLDYDHENVKRIVLDMYKIGIDVPPFPQLRDFVEIYLKPLGEVGYVHSKKGFFFIDINKIDYWSNIGLHIFEAEDMINVVKHQGIKFNNLRAPVTGPFTLASRVYIVDDISKGISATCLAKKELVFNVFGEFVINIVKYIAKLGYGIVFIDEPVFNYIIGRRKILFNYTEDDIITMLEKITMQLPNIEFGIHICGSLNTRIIELIIQISRIRYINIELHDSPLNIDLISREILEKYDKRIAPGIVSAQKSTIESIDEALLLLRNVYNKTGGRIDLVTGDCGFGGLRGMLNDREKEYNIALSKLKVIVEAVKRLESELRVLRE